MYPLLETINSPADLRLVPRTLLKRVADELRAYLLDNAEAIGFEAKTGEQKAQSK